MNNPMASPISHTAPASAPEPAAMLAAYNATVKQNWVDDPERLENHARAVYYYEEGNRNRWGTAYHASLIVGRYVRGATLALANDCRCSEDTIQRLAVAYRCYAALMAQAVGRKDYDEIIRILEARKLGYMHFYKKAPYLFSGEENANATLADLSVALASGAPAESIPAMNGRQPPSWDQKVLRIKADLTGLIDQAPKRAQPGLRRAINALAALLKKAGPQAPATTATKVIYPTRPSHRAEAQPQPQQRSRQ